MKSKGIVWLSCVVGFVSIALAFSAWQVRYRFDRMTNETAEIQLRLQAVSALVDVADVRLRLVEELLKEPTWRQSLGPALPDVARTMVELSRIYRDDGLRLSLILAVTEVESSFNPTALSTGSVEGTEALPIAYGLMQVTPATARPYMVALGIENHSPKALYRPETNLRIGVAYLVDLHRSYVEAGFERPDTWQWSVSSYFWGPRFLEKVNKANANLEYWMRVNRAEQAWKQRGFAD